MGNRYKAPKIEMVKTLIKTTRFAQRKWADKYELDRAIMALGHLVGCHVTDIQMVPGGVIISGSGERWEPLMNSLRVVLEDSKVD